MKLRAFLVALVLAQVGVFAAIAISVVDARDPLDREVAASFDSSFEALETRSTRIDARGCRKDSLDYYGCDARVRIRGRPGLARVHYVIRLEDDGCWATHMPVRPPSIQELPPTLHEPSGCID